MMKKSEIIERIKSKKAFISDMDGVIYHGNRLLPGVPEFVEWLKKEGKKFLFLTNSSERTPKELQEKMLRLGIDIDENAFYTSALATAQFLASQKPEGTAYIIGEAGLINAMYNAGYTMNNYNPDYVVVGDTRSYSFEKIEQAVNLVLKGAKLIGTNPDLTGPVENGIIPATKALISPIELSTGKQAYFVGKPNPLMMRIALKKIGCSNEETIIIGDRMDTDIIAGIESEIDTLLVLSGISTLKTAEKFAYRPSYILEGVSELVQ
ncbi:MAG: HAD family hydrolase [Bacteroidales bacterium]|mgnify:FL=1|jgi:NagD protein|nr:HAD family hydrolase [Bacteroidales bacterium]MDI9533562.1 HAD-IIA family hydrolase [Bacteroidota bacterium]MBK7731437.1 HAD family hydrolase [Bacteroidales bacterium]MBP7035261.1 HAD family hydrolase [Bacteroidales bacterium]MBP8708567.1 HAD family hydrolase [Bacteroidales bacterium]